MFARLDQEDLGHGAAGALAEHKMWFQRGGVGFIDIIEQNMGKNGQAMSARAEWTVERKNATSQAYPLAMIFEAMEHRKLRQGLEGRGRDLVLGMQQTQTAAPARTGPDRVVVSSRLKGGMRKIRENGNGQWRQMENSHGILDLI